MNAGFSSLTKLKEQLLAEALRVDTAYDAVILAIGQGTAAQFERHCQGRKFQRESGATEILSADRGEFLLSRFPVESVSAVEYKADYDSDWEAQSGVILGLNQAAGVVTLSTTSDFGPSYAQVRFTYTGGFWWDITEEGNDSLPSGATALPEDLRLAWFMQCRAAWQAIDKIGQDIVKTGSSSQFVTGSLGALELLEDVKAKLHPYIRFALL